MKITPSYSRVQRELCFPNVSCKMVFAQFICIYFVLFYFSQLGEKGIVL